MCECGCREAQQAKPQPVPAEDKAYVCIQCNTFKSGTAAEPAPECCGKPMKEMD